MFEIEWTAAAADDLENIRLYIGLFDPVASAQIAASLFDLAASLSHFPHRGRPAGRGRRELATVPPYVLRYVVEDDRVTILSVRHGARRPE